MTESEFEPPSVEEVAANLTLATDGPLAAFYKDSRKEHAEKTQGLTRIIQHLRPDIWDGDPNWALQTAIKEALRILPASGPENSKLRWEEIGQFLCGFRTGDIPRKKNGELPGYKEYVREMRTRAGLDDMPTRTFGEKVTAAFRLHLAEALLKLEPKRRGQLIDRGQQPKNDRPQMHLPSYVPRPALEQQFQELYDQGHKLIVLVGQPGMGKTWLAREVARQVTNADAPLIQIVEKRIHTPDLEVALRRYRITYTPTSEPLERLAALLCDERSPSLVILDNLESADDLRTLLPAELRAVLLATARAKGTAPPEKATFVAVGGMAQAEAEALVRHHARNLDPAEVEWLARELHGHALILRHASILLERGGLTIGDLAQSLRSTSATTATIGRMRTEAGARLTAVLDRVVEGLRSEDSLAYELLRLLAFVRFHASVSYQFLSAYACEVEQGCTQLRARQAVQALTIFALIDQTERDVRMHPLTRTLLAGKFAKEYDQVYALALKVRAKQKERCNVYEVKYHMPRVNPFELMDNGLYAYHEIDARWEDRYWAERDQRNEPPEPNEVPDWARIWNAVAFRKVVGEIRQQAGLPPLD